MEAILVYVTCASEAEAIQLGSRMVEEKLAACANLIPGMQSIYRWEGKIQRDQEFVLILKTLSEKLSVMTARVKELHSYEVPCVVALPILGGNVDYLNWLGEQVSSNL